MGIFLVDFEWQVDGKGYDLLDEEQEKPPFKHKVTSPWPRDNGAEIEVEASLLARAGSPRRIVPKGGQVIKIRPLSTRRLYLQFATIRSAEQLLKFNNKF